MWALDAYQNDGAVTWMALAAGSFVGGQQGRVEGLLAGTTYNFVCRAADISGNDLLGYWHAVDYGKALELTAILFVLCWLWIEVLLS